MGYDVHNNDILFNGALSFGPNGSITLAANAVGTATIQANAVTGPKLTASLGTGFIPLPLAEAREVFSNDYGNAATGAATGSGGVLAKDTTPVLERVNVATDKQARLKWAAGNTDEIQWSVVSPPDLDKTQPVNVKVRAKMGGGTDTPTLTVAVFEDVGGSDLGGATGALSSTIGNVQKQVTVTADPPAGTYKSWSVSLKPGAHATDAVEVYQVWLEYTRK